MASQNITADCEFNYETSKMKYVSNVNNCFLTNQAGLWTRNRVRDSILKIKAYKRKPMSEQIIPPVTIEGNEVDIAKDNGVEILIFLKDKKFVEVLPYEDCFDVFVDLHLRQSHAGYARMYDVLQNYFCFTSAYLECFVQSCNVCIHRNKIYIKETQASDDNIQNNKCKIHVQITFLDVRLMQAYADSIPEFAFMLVYKQKASGYILLRPLVGLDAEEVALELYNIFTDFGPPETIETTHINFLKAVLELLKLTPIKYYCIISENLFDAESLRCQITENINKWMVSSMSSNWAVACYTVQFGMNTDTRRPIDQLFGKRFGQQTKCMSDKRTDTIPAAQNRPQESCSTSDVSTSALNTEEDLGFHTEEVETEIKAGEDEDAVAHSEVDSNMGPTATEHILSVDSVSTTTSTPTVKKEKVYCHICKRVILFSVHTCSKCKKFIHIFCGLRLSVEGMSFEEFELVCKRCN